MTKIEPTTTTETREEIEIAAADFLRRRRFAEWGEAEQAELTAWLRESEARHVAFLRLETVLGRIERLAALRTSKPKRRPQIAQLQVMVPFLVSAAALGLILAFGVVGVRYFLRVPDRIYSTDIGGRTLLNFADGTQIELNTDTVVRYRMTNDERTVWLERGEAWFHVSHNAVNPFSVIVGKHRVTDLGTEFVVRRSAEGMEVALLKGRAALSTEGAQTAMLRPGDDAIATQTLMSVTRRTPQELADQFAWRQGELVFRNTRLADAVREFNRYNETKLVIVDPAVADLKLSAAVKTENFEGFLRLAEVMLNLRVDREGNDILIYGNQPEKTKKALRAKRGR